MKIEIDKMIIPYESKLLVPGSYKRTKLVFMPMRTGNGFYGTSPNPWLEGHVPGASKYTGRIGKLTEKRILKVTQNLQNGSNTVWLQHVNGSVSFLIIRDKTKFKQFTYEFKNNYTNDSYCTIEYEGGRFTIR